MRTDEPRFRAGAGPNPFRAGHLQRTGHAVEFLGLHGIQFMIAADHQCDDAAVGAVDQQRFDALRRRHTQLRTKLGNACGRSASAPLSRAVRRPRAARQRPP